MKKLDERDAFIATEAEKAAQGLSSETLPRMASCTSVLKHSDVWDRYWSQKLRGERVLKA
jgi:hypothetical protein